MKKKMVTDLLPPHCGIKLKSKKESLIILKELLSQLELDGRTNTGLAKIYRRMIDRSEEKST